MLPIPGLPGIPASPGGPRGPWKCWLCTQHSWFCKTTKVRDENVQLVRHLLDLLFLQGIHLFPVVQATLAYQAFLRLPEVLVISRYSTFLA